MKDQVGPHKTVIHIEACSRCKYHITNLWESERQPIYYHFCSHPSHKDKNDVIFHQHRGRLIGETDDTPDWCPARKESER